MDRVTVVLSIIGSVFLIAAAVITILGPQFWFEVLY